ncbi:MAG: hypothetical protein WAL66_03800, partial [Nitrososphaeraceae archaeon]
GIFYPVFIFIYRTGQTTISVSELEKYRLWGNFYTRERCGMSIYHNSLCRVVHIEKYTNSRLLGQI